MLKLKCIGQASQLRQSSYGELEPGKTYLAAAALPSDEVQSGIDFLIWDGETWACFPVELFEPVGLL